jgi:hypothetical protein
VAAAAPSGNGYELVVSGGGGGGGGGKVLGSREFARYYRQRHKPQDDRQIVVVNTMLAKCVGPVVGLECVGCGSKLS